MRLREYQHILDENIPKLSLLIAQNIPGRANDRTISGIKIFSEAIYAFKQVGLFVDQIEEILTFYFLVNRYEDETVIDINNYNRLHDLINYLIKTSISLKTSIDNIIREENPNSINIKLPKFKNIDELAKFTTDLKSVVYVYQYYGEPFELEGFDTGSEWFQLASIGSLGSLIYLIADKSLTLRNKWLEGEKTIAEIEKLKAETENTKAKTEILNALHKSNKESLYKLKEQLISEIITELNIKLPQGRDINEFKEHIGISIEKTGELIDQGMEIHPAFNATDDIKNLSKTLNTNIIAHKHKFIGIVETKLIKNNLTEEEN